MPAARPISTAAISIPRIEMLGSRRDTGRRLGEVFGVFAGAFAAFVIVVAFLSSFGLSQKAVALLVVLVTLVAYAILGVVGRTLNELDFFHAGRAVPGLFNGLGTGA